jgi:hypothetical protein
MTVAHPAVRQGEADRRSRLVILRRVLEATQARRVAGGLHNRIVTAGAYRDPTHGQLPVDDHQPPHGPV